MTGLSDKKKIKTGGLLYSDRPNDVVMRTPDIWYPDIARFQLAVNKALRWDYGNRRDLYDLYSSALMDTHLKGVLRKRKIAVSQFEVKFQKDGEPVDAVNEQIHSPWFRAFLKSLIDVQMWGFCAYQFWRDKNGWIQFSQIDWRHIEPHRREVLRYDTDLQGVPLDSFPNTLMLGDESEIGELMAVLPWIITKRQDTGDWAQYCQLFGMPIREYTYSGTDWETIERIKKEAETQGSNGVYLHSDEAAMKMLDSSSKSGSCELYKSLMEKCDEQISILILGNTLTTNVGDSGTQALGTVHKKEEDAISADDRGYVLDVLNYEMGDIFNSLGIDTTGGKWVYAEKEEVDRAQQAQIVVQMNSIGLPIDDDYLYTTFGIDKPADYDKIKADKEASKQAIQEALKAKKETKEDPDTDKKEPKKTDDGLKRRILNFFAEARNGAGTPKGYTKW